MISATSSSANCSEQMPPAYLSSWRRRRALHPSTAELEQKRHDSLAPLLQKYCPKIIGTLTHRYGGGPRPNRLNRQNLVFARAGTDARVQNGMPWPLIVYREGSRVAIAQLRRGTESCLLSLTSIAYTYSTWSRFFIFIYKYGISLLKVRALHPTPLSVTVHSKFGC